MEKKLLSLISGPWHQSSRVSLAGFVHQLPDVSGSGVCSTPTLIAGSGLRKTVEKNIITKKIPKQLNNAAFIGLVNCFSSYIFSQNYSLSFFLSFAHLWWFGVWGFGFLYWVFGVGVFS